VSMPWSSQTINKQPMSDGRPEPDATLHQKIRP
jgi:hypothetical protein